MKLSKRNSWKRRPSLLRFRTSKVKRELAKHVRSLSDTNASLPEGNTDRLTCTRQSTSARELDTQPRTKTPSHKVPINHNTCGGSEQQCNENEVDDNDDCFEFIWNYAEHTFKVPYHVNGQGSRQILFLPSIHIASSYKELIPLTLFFGHTYTTFTPDWPGFGNSSRLNCTYTSLMYLQFIRDFITEVMYKDSISVIACGHSCGYVLSLAKTYPQMWDRICLVSPTFRAPVKALGWHSISYSLLKSAVRSSVIGDYLYQKAVQSSCLRNHYETQIFKDKSLVSDDFIKRKQQVVNKTNGKFGPVSFFTGKLDIIKNREQLDSLISCVECPIVMVLGDNSPATPLSEMMELAVNPKVKVIRLEGSLGVAEESPRDVAEVLIPFFPKAKT
eukprot:g8124.t1